MPDLYKCTWNLVGHPQKGLRAGSNIAQLWAGGDELAARRASFRLQLSELSPKRSIWTKTRSNSALSANSTWE
jgi:hypothetical protein